ncbi:hypothetical protein PIROE2DRAFT_65267 [Piromyces sp. E2]|nr:hypothetical protein PIROE2DRAFT_65267 [Piromyces sp. E2]|eukprot:OUM56970.1 hypothetical protein PIROE2DRAFT_65267 [Piromyces sp. E2]
MIRIPSNNENGSFYKCSKHLSSVDVPGNGTPILPMKLKASSVTTSKTSQIHDLSYSSSLDMNISNELSQPRMMSSPNSIRVSNIEVLHDRNSQTNISNDKIPPPLNTSSLVSNAAFTTSPISEMNQGLFCEPVNSVSVCTSGIPTSPSLTVMPTQQSGCAMIKRHPKSLYIPHSRIQAVKNTSSGNISISSVLTTTEETKGRFQIEKSEERKITTIPNNNLSTNASSLPKCSDKYENDNSLYVEMKSNSYCNDDSNHTNSNHTNSNLTSSNKPRRFSANITKSELFNNPLLSASTSVVSNTMNNNGDKQQYITDKLNDLGTPFVSSYDNILKKEYFTNSDKLLSSTEKKESETYTSVGSISIVGKGIKENELKNAIDILDDSINLNNTSNEVLRIDNNNSNGDISCSASSSPKKKEIVKGRFTITRDS